MDISQAAAEAKAAAAAETEAKAERAAAEKAAAEREMNGKQKSSKKIRSEEEKVNAEEDKGQRQKEMSGKKSSSTKSRSKQGKLERVEREHTLMIQRAREGLEAQGREMAATLTAAKARVKRTMWYRDMKVTPQSNRCARDPTTRTHLAHSDEQRFTVSIAKI